MFEFEQLIRCHRNSIAGKTTGCLSTSQRFYFHRGQLDFIGANAVPNSSRRRKRSHSERGEVPGRQFPLFDNNHFCVMLVQEDSMQKLFIIIDACLISFLFVSSNTSAGSLYSWCYSGANQQPVDTIYGDSPADLITKCTSLTVEPKVKPPLGISIPCNPTLPTCLDDTHAQHQGSFQRQGNTIAVSGSLENNGLRCAARTLHPFGVPVPREERGRIAGMSISRAGRGMRRFRWCSG
jgi:hypothetical protein